MGRRHSRKGSLESLQKEDNKIVIFVLLKFKLKTGKGTVIIERIFAQGYLQLMGEAQWYISWNEFQALPPSLKQIPLTTELENRRIGTEFINKLGHALGM